MIIDLSKLVGIIACSVFKVASNAISVKCEESMYRLQSTICWTANFTGDLLQSATSKRQRLMQRKSTEMFTQTNRVLIK